MINFVAKHDRVLIEPLRVAEKTDGGVVMPETARYRTKEGLVRAVGPGCYQNGVFVECQSRVGERVIYAPYSGSEIKVDGVDYIVLGDRDVYGTVGQADDAQAPDA